MTKERWKKKKGRRKREQGENLERFVRIQKKVRALSLEISISDLERRASYRMFMQRQK